MASPRISRHNDHCHQDETGVSPVMVSSHEEMNPSRRSSMEDCSVYSPPGTWGAPDEDMAYLGVYDGHGGKWISICEKRIANCRIGYQQSLFSIIVVVFCLSAQNRSGNGGLSGTWPMLSRRSRIAMSGRC